MVGKYDKSAKYDWSWKTAIPKLPEIDFKALEETMDSAQKQIDVVGQIPNQRPNVLQSEVDPLLYKEYQDMIKSGTERVSKTFSEQGIKAGLGEQNKFLNDVKKQWQPGGIAHTLNSRYAAYNDSIKNIEEFQKKDKRGINSQLAKLELQESINKPINYNPSLGTFNNIKSPELNNDPELRGAIDDMLKEIKESGTTSFLGDFNKDLWIQKIQKEGRTEKQIEIAFEALSSQPEFQAQLQRDTRFKSYSTDPESYKESFKLSQERDLKELTNFAESAKDDPNKTKQLQNLLIQEGYNIAADGDYGSLTENATKEFLESKRNDVKKAVDEFNIKDSLYNDIKSDYLGYAKRGAYSKVDKDLVFNQGVKMRIENSLKKRELDIAQKRLDYEFSPQENSNVAVISGIAQQLPDVDKYIKSSKDQLKTTEGILNESLNKSKAFKGWKVENVASAYSKWTQVQGNTEYEKKESYKALLNQGGEYQFSDAEVNNLYQEMNAPNDSGQLKNVLSAYDEAVQTKNRFEDVKVGVAKQYVETANGKQELNILRQNAPKSFQSLSDEDLIKKSIDSPELFNNIKGGSFTSLKNDSQGINAADRFNSQVNAGVAKQEKEGVKYDWKDRNTYEVYSGSTDKILTPVLKNVAQAIETGTGNNFKSFGAIGLTFKNKKGEAVEGTSKKVNTIGIAKNSKGEPILKVGVTFTTTDGKNKDGFTEINIVPNSPESIQIKNSLTEEYINMINNGDSGSAAGILDNIQALNGYDNLKRSAIDAQVSKLNLNNTYNQGVLAETENGEIIDIGSLGNKSVDLHDDENIKGLQFKTLGVTTRSGNKLINVIVGDNGRLMAVPNDNGGIYYNSADDISKARLGRLILSNAQIQVNETKK